MRNGGIVQSGILLIDKPTGMTSHDVVSRVRRAAGTRKVGHAGTLDPMATGLLLIGINSSTRLLTYLVGADKTYAATITLGVSTTSDDADGETVAEAPIALVAALTDAAIEAGLAELRGDIMQVPNSVSAIRVDGKRSYDRVRAGEDVTLAARPVSVRRLEVIDRRRWTGRIELDVEVDCSSGTYIRALARDLGNATGVGGSLSRLRRTRVGAFDVAAASTLDDLDVASALVPPATVAASVVARWDVDEAQATALAHGQSLDSELEDGLAAAVARDERLIGIVKTSRGRTRSVTNFPDAETVGSAKAEETSPA